MLLVAALLPASTCEVTSKSRNADGSLSWSVHTRERTLWRNADLGQRRDDIILAAFCYGWPLPFLAYRRWRRRERTPRLLGIIETAAGALALFFVLVIAGSRCWTIFDEFVAAKLTFGTYLALAGSWLYLAAWPAEVYFRRYQHTRSRCSAPNSL